MRTITLLTLVFCCCSDTRSQDAAKGFGNPGNPAAAAPAVGDPFDIKAAEHNAMGEGMEMGYGEMGGMEEMYGMGMDASPSPDELFRLGLQRAITALKKAKTEPEKTALQGFIRKAFSERYDRSIKRRKRDLDRLKEQIAKLEQELGRREAAKERVIQLQLESVQLASEGLLELNELQGVRYGGGEEYGGAGMGSSMGLGN